MPFVSGFLRVRSGGHPDHELPEGSPGHPDNTLPGGGLEIDNSLPPGTPPIGVTLPEPPPGIWPPPSWSRPIVPVPPNSTLPIIPGTIWPNPARPDNTLPTPPGGQIDNSLPSQTFWVVCGIPGVGWRYIAVDPSLVAGMPLPPAPAPKG